MDKKENLFIEWRKVCLYGKGSFLLGFIVVLGVALLFGFEVSLLVLAERVVLGHECLHHFLDWVGFWVRGGLLLKGWAKGQLGFMHFSLNLQASCS